MARKIAEIQATMDVEQATQTNLTTLNSPSQTAIYTLWKFITSTIINYCEQLWDLYKVDLEAIVKNAPVGSNNWLQSRVLKFQYSASTPQVLAIDSNFAINYPTIDTTLQIITRCSVKTTPVKTVLVKVAKSSPPVALSAPELSSLSGYLSNIAFAGVNYIASSATSDKIYIKASIYYNGQYASTFPTNVISAINAYLSNIPFDGILNLLKLQDAIQAVPGFNNILIDDVACRSDVTAFGSKTYLIASKTVLTNSYQTVAGYIVEETTASNTFTDTLTFIAQ